MKHKRNVLWPALVAPALLAFTPRGDQVSFHPEAATKLTKTFETDSDTTLDEMNIVQNGQEMDPSQFGMELSASVHFVVSVTDEYKKVDATRALVLTRSFDEISANGHFSGNNMMTGEMSEDMNGSSELEGQKVEFTWDPDAEDYGVAFADDADGDEDLLEGLVADMDARAFLPTGEVSKGDSWSVDPQAVRTFFAPGGSVKLEMEALDEDMMGGMGNQPAPDKMFGDFEGDVTAQYGGTRDEGGVRVAVIELDLDVVSARDMTDMMADMLEKTMKESPMEMDMDVESADVEFTFEGTGTMLWNLDMGVIHSLELSGEMSQTMDQSMTVAVQGREIAIEQSMVFSGSYTSSVSTESSS